VDTAWPDSPGEAMAGIISAAHGNGPHDAAAALASLSAARRLAAELERGELALIEAARGSGATWSQISAALGTWNRQTAQERHADLARRCPRPPSVDILQAQPAPGSPVVKPGARQPEAGPPAGEDAPASAGQLHGQLQFTLAPAAPATPPGKPAMPRRRTAVPRITDEVIAERPLRAGAGTGLRRDPGLAGPGRRPGRRAGPADLARGAQPSRRGARRPVGLALPVKGNRQGHTGRERPGS
jgi:hypothetical protein